MTPLSPPLLNEEEILFHRMETFHRQRVDVVASGDSPLGKREDGYLVFHFVPHSCLKSRDRLDDNRLKESGDKVRGSRERSFYRFSRFNVDGILKLDTEKEPTSYSQIFRDGRIESVISDIVFSSRDQIHNQPISGPRYLNDPTCERAFFTFVEQYLEFCTIAGLHEPITLFSALVGCRDVRFYSDRGYYLPQGGIDRCPAFLPEVEIQRFDIDPETLMRPWCDTLFQALGLEKSLNFDKSGKWEERRR